MKLTKEERHLSELRYCRAMRTYITQELRKVHKSRTMDDICQSIDLIVLMDRESGEDE
jgi:hypothetical protein